MPFINYQEREITFKLVYYGPGMSGKTTNLMYIHKMLDPERKGEMVILDTEEERTLFFDFFPLELGEIAGYNVRFNMYTVPGQVYYEASRKLILDGADGVIFVADSAPLRFEANLELYRMMEQNMLSYEMDPQTFPIVLQYNKRDIEGPIRLGSIEEQLGLNGIPVFESVAVRGEGVMDTIRKASQLVIERFQL